MSRGARISVRAAVVLVLVSSLSLVGLAWFGRTGTGASVVTLFVSGDTRNYLEPCGCRRDQAGGIGARATLIERNQAGDRLTVDVGNLTSGDRSYELLKLDYLLRGMALIGYDAVNLGRREAGLDRQTLAKIVARREAPFVSCNLLDSQTGERMAAESLVVKAGGVRIGITGVVEAPADEVGPGLRIRPAAEALADTLPALKERCDTVMVLAWARPETLKAIAERFHEIDWLLGGDVPQSSDKAELLNRAEAFNVVGKGKVLGKLTFVPAGGKLELSDSAAMRVADTIPSPPRITALLDEYRKALRERSVEPTSEEGMEPIATAMTADRYLGQQACAGCHPAAHRISAASKHVTALATLEKKNAQYDPECLRCHAVGYGAKDGFVNARKTPGLAGVQCENCHGRGGDHVDALRSGRAAKTLRPVTPNTCVKCHDRENSESFDYDRYWPKIKH